VEFRYGTGEALSSHPAFAFLRLPLLHLSPISPPPLSPSLSLSLLSFLQMEILRLSSGARGRLHTGSGKGEGAGGEGSRFLVRALASIAFRAPVIPVRQLE
jgi:hypothetical protein